MRTITLSPDSRRRGRLLSYAVLASATALVVALPGAPSHADVPAANTEGIMCEHVADPTAPIFDLDATSGYVSMPDGNSIYMWSYTASGRGFQLPGPTLCVDSGTKVTVVLHNTLREDTSIIFSGQEGVTADGATVQPQFDTSNTLTSLAQTATANGGSVTYQFTAGAPGTYLYSSGTDVAKQREMGLYGALVVRPPGHPDQANDQGFSAFQSGQEYLYVLSQIDPDLHLAVERNRPYDYTKSVGRYYLINGRSMPDTLAPNNAAWLPSQPYGAVVRIQPNQYPDPTQPANTSASRPKMLTNASYSKPALLRYVNAGEVNYPFHPHGSDQLVVGRDGSPTLGADQTTQASYLKYLIDVGPGQSVDTLVSWKDEYDPATNPIPSDVQLPQLQDQIVGPGTETWFSENPYLGAPGGQGPIPTGMVQNNQCGEYYQIAHSHALEQSTNYGASFGGMMTVIRIDPVGGCK